MEQPEPAEKKRRVAQESAATAVLAGTADDYSTTLAAIPVLMESDSSVQPDGLLCQWAQQGKEFYIQMFLIAYPRTIPAATLATLAVLIKSPVFALALARRDPREPSYSMVNSKLSTFPTSDMARNLMNMRRCGALQPMETVRGKFYSLETLVDEGANADDFTDPATEVYCAQIWMELAAPKIRCALVRWLPLTVIDYVVLPFLKFLRRAPVYKTIPAQPMKQEQEIHIRSDPDENVSFVP
jgi:hypothetical protein